jgi:hypothetical protein
MVDHFYTTDPKGEHALENGYQYLGVLCYVHNTHIKGTVPVYRSYHPTRINHFYSTSRIEHDNAVQKYCFKPQHIAWFMFNKKLDGNVALKRYYEPNTQRYMYLTDEEQESRQWDVSAYTKAVVAGYVQNNNASAQDGTRAVPLYWWHS